MMDYKDTVMVRTLMEGDNSYERKVKQAEISFKAGIKEVTGFKCNECSTPGFIHLVIPVSKIKEWKYV